MIIRAERPDSNFYILDKKISEDKKLSWGARGLLVFLLGKPDNWQVSTQNLINETSGSGKPTARDGVRSLVNELIEAGYIKRHQIKGESGKIEGVNYLVSEVAKPETPKPETANPATAKPATANPPLIRTETPTSNETPSITEKTTTESAKSRFDPLAMDLPSNLSAESWQAWIAYRRSCKMKIVERTMNAQLTFLAKQGLNADAVIEQTIRNGWQGLFELKAQKQGYVSEKEKSQAAARATFAKAGIHGFDFNDNERVVHDYVEQPKLQVIHNA